LEGGFNLRDFGGYLTADGRRVKRAMLYRSGIMTMLTDADEAHLCSLGIRAVCDFRRGDEREAEPTRWIETAGASYWSLDYSGSSGILGPLLKDDMTTADMVRDAMITMYRDIPVDHAPSYRVMFEQLAGGEAPLLINCSAGKDRTGVGAALILSALGVSREVVEEDYLLTNVHADFGRLFSRRDRMTRTLQRDPEVVAPISAADTAYLNAAFDELDRRYGGLHGYLEELGVNAAALAKIKDLLLD